VSFGGPGYPERRVRNKRIRHNERRQRTDRHQSKDSHKPKDSHKLKDSHKPKDNRQRAESGAMQARSGLSQRVQAWLFDHRLVAAEAFARLRLKPVASLVTCLVIGIALALPAGLFVGLDNVQRLTTGWDSAARMSVFLKDDVNEDQGRALARQVASRSGVASATYVSREEALVEFGQLSGFDELLGALPENPLPAVVVVAPLLAVGNSKVLQDLQIQLQGRAEVELVQLDIQWVQRLYGMLDLVRQITLLLGMLLGFGVLLVTGNTISLTIESRRKEIVVVKLVGGTDAFVRRPYLYTGVWYGLGGGLIAWLLVGSSLYLLDSPVSALASLYGSTFRLAGFTVSDCASLVLGGALLGWGGAWLAVSRHLGEIVPR
jgi:cell division transport system permease protein